MMSIDKKESMAISYLRVVALMSIVACHFLQAMNNRWAWVLNIGVQVFFFISGYLYGHKIINDWVKFYLGRIIKVYVPFIVTAVIFILCYSMLAEINISTTSIISYVLCTQWLVGGIKGMGHLWFITAIFVCYFSTPLLWSVRKVSCLSLSILIVYGLFEIIIIRYNVSLFLPIIIYSFGYLYATLRKRQKMLFTIIVILLCVVVMRCLSWNQILHFNDVKNQLFHTFGGLGVGILFIALFSHVNLSKYKNNCIGIILQWLDHYSYEIYLLHHPLILGPLSLMALSGNIIANIFFIIALTIILSWFLKKLCLHIRMIVELYTPARK